MTQGRVVGWLIGEGAEIARGAEVVEIETEKIAGAAEAPVGGVLRRQVAKEGEVVPVAGLLGVIAGPGVDEDEIQRFVAAFASTFVPEEVKGPGTERVEVAGRSLRYLKRGDGGQPVILLHGFGGDLNNWLFNHEALAAGRAVYALDLPGHGESSKDVGDGTTRFFAGVVSDFMDAVGLPEAHVVGHSLGGAVGLELALEHPQRVPSITLICSAGLGPEINGDYVDGFIGAGRRKELRPYLESLFADPSLVNRRFVDDVLRFKRFDGVDSALRAVAGKFVAGGQQAIDIRDRLAEITAPILVIWGAMDQIIPASHAQGIPGPAKVEIIEGCGHMAQMEAASEVNRLIDRVLG